MAGRGPLPNPSRRRTNAPTIPTTALPAHGFKGRIPTVPKWISLGDAGRSWWRWAWRTPQAAGWGVFAGGEPFIARRALLEDEMCALECLDGADELRRVALRTQVIRKMNEMDARLGLDPKGLADLRWKIIDEDVTESPQPPAETGSDSGGNVSNIDERRRRITGAP